VKITTLEGLGALKLSGTDVTLNQVITKTDLDSGGLTFDPVADANGSTYTTFAFSVNDGSADSVSTYTMTIDVTAVADVPIIANLPPESLTDSIPITPISFVNTGSAALTCGVAPTLPAGLVLNTSASTCEITGTPAGLVSDLIYTITATGLDGADTATVNIEVVAGSPITCDTGDLSGTCTINTAQNIATSGEIITGSGNLVITSSGSITVTASPYVLTISMAGDVTLDSGGAEINANVDLGSNNLTIGSGSKISASAKGFAKGLGDEAGVSSSGNGGGGGGHGGAGGDGSANAASGGGTYGNSAAPTTYGSGGGDGQTGSTPRLGGAGGGAIKIDVTNTFTLTGIVEANGAQGNNSGGGGGAGGSIWVDTSVIAAAGGLFSAVGGDAIGTGPCGGGGGGGRIDVLATSKFSGMIDYSGGALCNGSNDGDSGTVEKNYLFCDTGTVGGASCTLSTPTIVFPGELIDIAGNLLITGSGDLYSSDSQEGFDLTVGGTFTVASGATWQPGGATPDPTIFNLDWFRADTFIVDGTVVGNFMDATFQTMTVSGTGVISANELGYAGSTNAIGGGPGGGGSSSSGTSGGGGAHGGAGGTGSPNGNPGAIYDDNNYPIDFGSAGGGNPWKAGATGGGYLKFVVKGTLTYDGVISANGQSGEFGAFDTGGGAGGSIFLDAGTIAGAGSLLANGGGSTSTPGGGGGGIIVVYTATDSRGASSESAAGGGSSVNPGIVGFVTTRTLGTEFQRIFASSAVYDGSAIGSNASGDSLCTSLATSSGLSGTFSAFLSSDLSMNTIQNSGAYDFINTRGELVSSQNDLFAADWINPVSYDEHSEHVNDSGNGKVWTGSDTAGSASGNCTNFSTTSGTGLFGDATLIDSNNVSSGITNCTYTYRIYCISKD
jgi:hypothetical protein